MMTGHLQADVGLLRQGPNVKRYILFFKLQLKVDEISACKYVWMNIKFENMRTKLIKGLP